MKVLVTGANGFIGKNMVQRLRERGDIEVLIFLRGQDVAVLNDLLINADAVIHLAGENRPKEVHSFHEVNTNLTKLLCSSLSALGKKTPVIFASSIQANLNNPYGRSKLAAEEALQEFVDQFYNPVAIYRLPGVFGKWCKPNYNSVVATFCYNKAHDCTVNIINADECVRLVYVDDVVNAFLNQLTSVWSGLVRPVIHPEYSITLGELSNQIDAFKNCRSTLISERVGTGLTRALYSTYLSYLPVNKFSYSLTKHSDARGVFVEMLKTPDAGQFSFFTIYPGNSRGGHYHHTKTEKFLVIKGRVRFGFRHILTNSTYFLEIDGNQPQIVETVPGWTHNMTNIGLEEVIVMLWANEIFDRANPDTIASEV